MPKESGWLPTDGVIFNVLDGHWENFLMPVYRKKLIKFTAKKIAERLRKSFATFTVATDDEDAYYTLLESDWQELLKEIEES